MCLGCSRSQLCIIYEKVYQTSKSTSFHFQVLHGPQQEYDEQVSGASGLETHSSKVEHFIRHIIRNLPLKKKYCMENIAFLTYVSNWLHTSHYNWTVFHGIFHECWVFFLLYIFSCIRDKKKKLKWKEWTKCISIEKVAQLI